MQRSNRLNVYPGISSVAKLEDFDPSPTVAYIMCSGAALLWASSTVIGRGVHEIMPPMGLSFWRYSLATLILYLLVRRELPAKWAMIRANAKLIWFLGFLQVGASAMFFLGLNFTTAINGALLNASQPALTVFPAWLLTRDRVNPVQGFGIAVAVTGIAVMIGRGDLGVILGLQFNIGDIIILIAIGGWSIYATILHRLPKELGFATSLFLIFFSGTVALLPIYVVETIQFRPVPLTLEVVETTLVLGIIVSLGSLAMWNAALRSIGPNRATIFINLIPIFGVVLAITFLGEQLFSFHLAGAALVAGGISLVILRGRKKE